MGMEKGIIEIYMHWHSVSSKRVDSFLEAKEEKERKREERVNSTKG